MKVIRLKAGEALAKKQDKVSEWYLIQSGAVEQRFGHAQIALGQNAIIGILESEWFAYDYVAKEDSQLIVIPCKNANDLQILLAEHENFRAIFIKTAIEQRNQMLWLYQEMREKVSLLYASVLAVFNDYEKLCEDILMTQQNFSRLDTFGKIQMVHRAEEWEFNNSNSIAKGYLKEYIQLMMKDDAMCVGAIMEAAAQMRRVSQGIGEMNNYLEYNKDILFADSENDLFHLFFDLAVAMAKKGEDTTRFENELKRIAGVMEQLDIYDKKQLLECEKAYKGYDFSSAKEGRLDVGKEDCFGMILSYAGFEREEIKEYKDLLSEYKKYQEAQVTEGDAFRVRKLLTQMFYKAYYKAFLHAMEDREKLSPVLIMFFNFGFMDSELTGIEQANALYNLTDHLGIFESEHVYTIFRWLTEVYKGNKKTSRNDFDLDFNGYLQELRKNGELTEQQVADRKEDRRLMVEFEIMNMFQSAHRMTFGSNTTFCPILSGGGFINSIEKMAITSDKIIAVINKIRELDYSVFYREVTFSDVEHGINNERIQKEVYPDIILMPDTGIRAVMWQETEGAKADTSARFLFPMFSAADLEEQMLETLARYRWEICRHVQGVHWNDIRDKSLTAEYYDYLQFYRKNSALSTEAKEKVKTMLLRVRNNFKEAFVKDYLSWMKYEAKGSFRLNRVARDILIAYCPFSKETRRALTSNPLYQNAFLRMEAENRKKEQRLTALYQKYEEAGGTIDPDLKANLKYYQL